MAYWYNVDSGKVETDEDKSQGDHLMGPYDTEDAARRALDTAREKTEAWDAADRKWEDGED